MNKTILVTGAAGQLGSEIRRAVEGSSNTYIFTDCAELDITDAKAVADATKNVDVIINCAAYTAVDKAESDEAIANTINNLAVGNLANAVKANGATLIHISTDYVFDGKVHESYTEEQPTNPLGVYGATKLAGEQSIIESDCNYIIIRTSWLYSSYGKNFVKTMLSLMIEREEVSVVCDQVGSPTYAADLAAAIVYIIESDKVDKCGIYHYCNAGQCSWYDLAKTISEMSGSSCKVEPIMSWDYPTAVERPQYTVLDTTKFRSTFDVAIPGWRKSLERCIEKLRK